MNFRTPVSLPSPCVTLSLRSRVMWAGSCFAQHMGQHLSDALPEGHVAGLPNGVLYNPLSIADALWELVDFHRRREGEEPWCFECPDGMWRHWAFSTQTFAPSHKRLLQLVKEKEDKAILHLEEADVLLVTFSTDTVYELADGPLKGKVVANCHKQPASMFKDHPADMQRCFAVWNDLLKALRMLHPGVKVVMTLSPYRYVKAGLHANALSKARLLLLIDRLQYNFPDIVTYFPAFEIINDELRDYRFYAPDMLHPSGQAIDYVWEQFREWTFSPELSLYAAERGKLLSMMRHRPQVTEGPAWEKFEARKREQQQRVQRLEIGNRL